MNNKGTMVQPRRPIWAFASLTIFVLLGVSHGLAEDKPAAAAVHLEFEMLDETELRYPINDREDLSVSCGGGKGVLISPHWVLTASHCITAKKQKAGKVVVSFPNADGKVMKIKVDKVIRHPNKDMALLRLVKPVKTSERMPLLLLRECLLPIDGKLSVKKVAGNGTWRDIPVIGKKDNLRVTDKSESRGKAGTSGGPWVIHSPEIGDVLIGVTHGGGRAPQVAYAAQWLEYSVRKFSNDGLLWATKKQTLNQERISPAPPAPPCKIKFPLGEDL